MTQVRHGGFVVEGGEDGPPSWSLAPTTRAAEQITKLTEITLATQCALRITTLGVDYHAYLKFLQLTPIVNYSINGKRSVRHPDTYAPLLRITHTASSQ